MWFLREKVRSCLGKKKPNIIPGTKRHRRDYKTRGGLFFASKRWLPSDNRLGTGALRTGPIVNINLWRGETNAQSAVF